MDVLPPEIWLSIIQLASAEHPESHLQGLINIALVSKQFHHVIFCGENDSVIWKPAAVSLGIHPATLLDEVVFTGRSSPESRSWRTVYKFTMHWQKPFPAEVKMPKLKKVAWNLPALKDGGDGFVRRTFEMCCCGEGRGLSYRIKQPVVADKGNIIFEARNIDNDNTAVAAGLLEAGEERARQVSGRARRAPKFTQFAYPLPAGHMVTEEGGEFTVSKIDPTTGNTQYTWLLGQRQPDRFTSFKDTLVAITYHGPDDEMSDIMGTERFRSIFLCLKANEPKPLWIFDVSSEWYNQEDDYRGFAHVKNFHVTSKYLVALFTRHPSPMKDKLSGTYFAIMSLTTGEVIREIKIHKKAVSPVEPAAPLLPAIGAGGPVLPLPQAGRPSYTTAFSHDFILTDTMIVSGGPAGELLVWCLFGKNASDSPICTIPMDRHGPFQATFTDLQLSVCGTYLAVTTSDRMYIYDIITKKPIEVYHNGRVVSEGNRFARNPLDDFPAGVWVRWRDWKLVSLDESHALNKFGGSYETEKYWKRLGDGVAYLSEAGIELSYDNPLRALTVPKRRPRWLNTLRRHLYNNSSWILLTLVGLLFAGLYSVLGVGKTYLAGYLGRILEARSGQS